MDRKIKIAVVGVGFFGERHAKVYSEMENVQLVAVVDADIKRAQEIAARYRCESFCEITPLFGKIDAASIVTPTKDHVTMAVPLLNAGVDLLIEKPITATLQEADEIIRLAQQKGRVVHVGHIERYNPALLKLRAYPIAPRLIECHRMGPFVERAANVSVVLDLMIHDIDIVLSLTESKLVNVEAVGLSVVSPEIDIAHARLYFSNGLVANLMASRVSEERVRTVKIFQEQSYFLLNYATRELTVYKERLHQKYSFEQEDTLKMEIGGFLSAVCRQPCPTGAAANLSDGTAALAVALQIIDAIKASRS